MTSEPVQCPQCRHTNPPGSRFCNACGAPVASARPADDPANAVIAALPGQKLPAIGSTIPQPVAPDPVDADLLPGSPIDPRGRYMVEQSIGKGGFGQAYLVYDRQLKRYCVAKRQVPNPAWNERTRELAIQNFHREAQLLVTLNTPGHPHIPEIYEFIPEQNCLVMKYVEGRDIGYILGERGTPLDQTEALNIIRDVCSALVYMHARRPEPVLHRDIKPTNVILDSSGRVWLIDFGLSKATPLQVVASDPNHTQMAGTIGFTPPEQWRGRAEPRSDVYALAATLHMMLTGYQPTLSRADLPAFLRGQIGLLPSARRLDPSIHPEVDALITRSIAFNPTDRPSAAEFLAILDKLLMPVARANLQAPDGVSIADEHALAVWAEQHWDQALGWLYSNLTEQVEQLWGSNRLAADMRAIVAQHAADQHAGLDTLLAIIDPADFGVRKPHLTADRRGIDFGSLDVNGQREQILMVRNDGRRYVRVAVQTPPWVTPSSMSLSLAPGQQARLKLRADMRRAHRGGKLRGSVLLRDRSGASFRIELKANLSPWRALWRQTLGMGSQRSYDWESSTVRSIRLINAHRGGVWGVDFSPDGKLIASGGWDQCLRIWRAEDGAAVQTLDDHAGNLQSVAFSFNGRLLATAGSNEQIKLWNMRDRRLLKVISGHRGYLESVHFSPDGQLLISNGGDRTVRLWRISDAAQVQLIRSDISALSVDCSPDGQDLALGCEDRRIRIWSIAENELRQILNGHTDGVPCVAYSPDGNLLASGGADGLVCVWELESGELRHRLRGHQNTVRSVAIHPDGHVIASGGVDGSIRLWRSSDGALIQVLTGHNSGVLRVCFSPDGGLLASGGGDGTIMLWQPDR